MIEKYTESRRPGSNSGLFFVNSFFEHSHRKMRILVLLISVLLLSACSNYQKVAFMGEAQGTYYAITYYDESGRLLQTEIDSLLKEFDMMASLWQPQSTISLVNENRPVELGKEFIEIFNQAKQVSAKTKGAFDITVGPLTNAWGFWFREKIDVNQQVLDSLLPLVGFEQVRIENGRVIKEKPGIHFDFNAIAQGYSVDMVADFLESKGIHKYLIDIGGEVLAGGRKPGGEQWKVGIEKPVDEPIGSRELEAIVFLNDKALATSGSYRKFYVEDGVKYSHTIDPRTGYPVQHSLLSVSVLAKDCVTADAYATAFMVMGLEESIAFLKEQDELEAFFIYSDEDGNYRTHKTKGMRKIMYK